MAEPTGASAISGAGAADGIDTGAGAMVFVNP